MVVLRRGAVASISSLISVVEGPVVIKDRHREVGREASPTRARTGGLCGEEVPELWQTLLAWLLAHLHGFVTPRGRWTRAWVPTGVACVVARAAAVLHPISA